jgi:hypothetical protein
LPEKLAGAVYGIVLGVLFGAPLGWVILHLRGPWLLLFMVASGWTMGVFLRRMTTTVVEGTANAFLRLVWPTGDSTPYERTYSAEQAMAVRGDIDGAITGFAMAMRQHPTDPEPRFQAAEILFRSPEPERAAKYFSEGRRLSGENRARELYATQRLIDLYLGPLGDNVRALVELRRLVERFPGTREAEAAHKVLNELKAGLQRGSDPAHSRPDITPTTPKTS